MDAVSLIVQIYLEQNRTDLAVKEVAAARRWAQDNLLVNLAESWVGVRVVCEANRVEQIGIQFTNVVTNRAATSTNKHSTFTKSSRRLHQHRRFAALFHKPSVNCTLEDSRKHRLLWNRPFR